MFAMLNYVAEVDCTNIKMFCLFVIFYVYLSKEPARFLNLLCQDV